MAYLFGEFNLSPGWQVWGVAAAGLAAGFVALVLGRRLFAPAPPPPAAAAPDPPAGPDPFEVGSASEKRATLRRKGSTVEVLVTDEAERQPPWPCWVLDRSLGGLCLGAERGLPPGTVLRVRPRAASAAAPWVEVEVRSCKAEGGGWQLGCAFRKTPPYSVLLLFG